MKNKVKVGDKVRLKKDLEGYYRYGGKIHMVPAGTIGTVGAIDCPAVTGRERNFICVDFTNPKQRVGAFEGEYEKMK